MPYSGIRIILILIEVVPPSVSIMFACGAVGSVATLFCNLSLQKLATSLCLLQQLPPRFSGLQKTQLGNLHAFVASSGVPFSSLQYNWTIQELQMLCLRGVRHCSAW